MGNLYLSSPSISFKDTETFFDPRYQKCRATPLLLPAPIFDFHKLTCTRTSLISDPIVQKSDGSFP